MIKSARSGATVVIGIAQTTRRYHTGRLWSLQEGNVGSTIMWVGCSTVRYRPLHNRYVGYTLSCTRSVALIGPVGPRFLFFIIFIAPTPPPPFPSKAPHLPRDQKRSAQPSIQPNLQRHSPLPLPQPPSPIRPLRSRTAITTATAALRRRQRRSPP